MTETPLILLCVIALAAAVILTLARMVKGPSAIDRAVANEVLVSTIVCALGVESAVDRQPDTLPILVSLSLVGFLASVAVARFVARDRDGVQLGDDGYLPETGPQEVR